jgi:hypothetical protein
MPGTEVIELWRSFPRRSKSLGWMRHRSAVKVPSHHPRAAMFGLLRRGSYRNESYHSAE